MKFIKIIFFILLINFIFSTSVFAAGTITQSLTNFPRTNLIVLTFTCTADSGDASFPSTTATSTEITNIIKGMYIIEVRVNPGATSPSPLYDIVINDTDGIDLMGGELANLSATVSERKVPALKVGTLFGETPIDGAITPVITGNLINSAQTTIKVFLSR